IFLFLLLIPGFLFAEQSRFQIYSREQGLPQSSVLKILQDQRGFLWIATSGGGVSRFDGRIFYNFSARDGLVSNVVNSLFLDRSGAVWLATPDGLSRIMGKTVSNFSIRDGLANNTIWSLAEDAQGRLWVGGEAGVNVYDGRKFEKPAGFEPLEKTVVKVIFRDREGRLWFGSAGAGAWCYDGRSLTALSTRNGLPHNSVSAILEDHDGALWFGTDGGLGRYDGKTWRIYSTRNGLTDSAVSCLLEDRQNRLWIGTKTGLNRMKGESFLSFKIEQGLSTNWVTSLYEDREGGLWIGTFSGLCQLRGDEFTYITQKSGLNDPNIWGLAQDRKESFWVGTSNGLSRFSGGKSEIFTTKNGLVGNHVFSIYDDGKDVLWICTDKGVNRYDGKSFQPFFTGKLPTPVYWVTEDGKGNYWFGTAKNSVKYDGRTIEAVITSREEGSNKTVHILKDSQGRLWFATRNGLSMFDGREFKVYTTRDGLNSNSIQSLAEDGSGNIWIGTVDKGVNRFDGRSFTSFSMKDGLTSDSLYSFLFDAAGDLWIGTDNGVDRLDVPEFNKSGRKNFLHFGLSEGFLGVECNTTSSARDAAGNLYFGTIGGVMIYHPGRETPPNKLEPITHISDLRLSLKAVDWMSLGLKPDPLSGLPSHPVFPWNRNHITFDYVAISLTVPEKVRYRYKLDPLEKDWSPETQERFATYASLPPGSYVFRIKACNNAGLWNRDGAAYAFTIKPPFWKNPWIQALAGVLVLSAGFSFYRRRVRNLTKRKEELERIIDERTRQLKEAYQEVEKLSITDSLTGLYNRRYFQDRMKKDAALAVRQTFRKPTERTSFSIGFLMIDIDFFKQVNDSYSHDAGDLFLKAISARLNQTIRASDTLVRWGGEEFLLMSKENDTEAAGLLAERMRRAVADVPFEIAGNSIHKTISIGYCAFPFQIRNARLLSWEETLHIADTALYIAKHSGRNCSIGVEALKEDLSPEDIAILKSDLPAAVKRDLIKLRFGPADASGRK
ncbi:MAG: diguanylate cyclase, partial [Candidatus Aminicenantes bacterium]|nr:diguanylate cyclase [Candidatus Aminicenantes bacterium]